MPGHVFRGIPGFMCAGVPDPFRRRLLAERAVTHQAVGGGRDLYGRGQRAPGPGDRAVDTCPCGEPVHLGDLRPRPPSARQLAGDGRLLVFQFLFLGCRSRGVGGSASGRRVGEGSAHRDSRRGDRGHVPRQAQHSALGPHRGAVAGAHPRRDQGLTVRGAWPCRVAVFFLISATRYRGRNRRVTARPRLSALSAHALLTHAGRSRLRRSGRLWAGRGGGAYSSHRNRCYLRRRQIKHIVPERRDQQAHSQRRGNSGGRSASGRARRRCAADQAWEAGAEQSQDAKS